MLTKVAGLEIMTAVCFVSFRFVFMNHMHMCNLLHMYICTFPSLGCHRSYMHAHTHLFVFLCVFMFVLCVLVYIHNNVNIALTFERVSRLIEVIIAMSFA